MSLVSRWLESRECQDHANNIAWNIRPLPAFLYFGVQLPGEHPSIKNCHKGPCYPQPSLRIKCQHGWYWFPSKRSIMWIRSATNTKEMAAITEYARVYYYIVAQSTEWDLLFSSRISIIIVCRMIRRMAIMMVVIWLIMRRASRPILTRRWSCRSRWWFM